MTAPLLLQPLDDGRWAVTRANHERMVAPTREVAEAVALAWLAGSWVAVAELLRADAADVHVPRRAVRSAEGERLIRYECTRRAA